ncbi:MAG: glycosyltransferase family 39 protein [Candidatus Kerfeldbacteria bacterium]|nr:glycosyltransferase family 39 protein [Candidatus Kerfeldbacteria bacterium]
MHYRKIQILAVILLLGGMLALEISSIRLETQTTDEGAHLAAGYSYLATGDFRLNREHPPLIKELAALPLYLIHHSLNQPFNSQAWRASDQWLFAKNFLYYNRISADTLFFLGRLPIMCLSLLLGWWIFRWTKEMFGTPSAFIALIFYVLDPTIIAHSRYVTTDLALTLCFYITIYYFYKYLKFGQVRWLIGFWVVFGIAQASKYSAIFLIPIILIMYFLSLWRSHELRVQQTVKNFFLLFGGMAAVTIMILSVVYGFQAPKLIDDISVQKLLNKREVLIVTDQVKNQDVLIQKIISLADPASKSGKIVSSLMQSVPIPFLPYFDGLIQVYFHDYFGHTSYLMGNHAEFGWWYYFPVAVAIKTPAITLVGLAAVILFGVYRAVQTLKTTRSIKKMFARVPIHFYFLILPPSIFFLISMNGSLNLGIRHVLVIYPFIFSILGWAIYRFWTNTGWFPRLLIIIGMSLYILSSITIFPNYLSYFNEFIGGSKNGYRYLVDSNNDWGQDVKKLKTYLRKHNIPYVCMAYFGQTELNYYGIDYRYLPDNQHFTSTDNLNCVVAISITALYSKEGEYAWLQKYSPNTTIGYSIHLYDFRKP